MGDWTSGSATIHSCPPHRVRAVSDTLKEYGFAAYATTDDTAGPGSTAPVSVTVGEPYVAEQFPCHHAIDLATDLIRCAPEAAFTVYEQPAYELVGVTCIYVPGLGRFTASCDNSGEPVFTQSRVLELACETDAVRNGQFGVPWLTAIADLPTQVVVEPDRFATHWIRRHGEVVVIDGRQGGGDLVLPVSATEDVDTVLSQNGFQRADEWRKLDDTAQLWRTDFYRSAST